jgi:hypothetical protein
MPLSCNCIVYINFNTHCILNIKTILQWYQFYFFTCKFVSILPLYFIGFHVSDCYIITILRLSYTIKSIINDIELTFSYLLIATIKKIENLLDSYIKI